MDVSGPVQVDLNDLIYFDGTFLAVYEFQINLGIGYPYYHWEPVVMYMTLGMEPYVKASVEGCSHD